MSQFSMIDLGIIALLLDEDNRRHVRFAVRKSLQRRKTEGEYWTLFRELMDDEERFYQYFRMSQHQFHVLLMKIEKDVKKSDTSFKEAIGPKERLAVCLRFLSTGDSFRTIAFSYRLGHATVARIVKEVCDAIVKNLLSQCMPIPSTEEWNAIAKDFQDIWDFPNCIGAIDGKHVTITAPGNSGTHFFKKTFSVVLMALVDANYKFIAVDIGGDSRNSDRGIFSHSKLGQYLEKGKFNFPGEKKLPSSDVIMPHVIVGDEAFPLKKYLLRPYPGKQLEQDGQKRIFNSRLNHARQVVENAFGILSQKFRLYNRRMQLKPETVDSIIMTTCILHNYIKEGQNSVGVQDSLGKSWQQLPRLGGNATLSAFHVRDSFKAYFCSNAGRVEWQDCVQKLNDNDEVVVLK